MNPRHGVTVALLLLTAAAGTAHGQAPDGAALYRARCASCHDRSDGRTPPRESLQGLTAQRILRALDFGPMMTIAYALTRAEREAVATHLGRPGSEPPPKPEAFCASRRASVALESPATWNGWSPTQDISTRSFGQRAISVVCWIWDFLRHHSGLANAEPHLFSQPRSW